MRIVVTGAAGFMGSWITEALAVKGHEILAIDDLSAGLKNTPTGCTFQALDLCSESTGTLIKAFEPEVLYHLAANAREGASHFQPDAVTRANLSAYVTTLENAIAGGVDRVVLFSSMAVYGDQDPPFDETDPRSPVDVYGVNKAAMEHVTEILSDIHGFKYTIVRPHNVFGERQSLHDKFRNVVAIFMNRIMRGEPIYIYGDGEQTRAFSYILDSLPCYIRAMEHDKRIFNIGGIEPITINELVELVRESFFEYTTSRIEHLPDRPREVKHAWCTSEASIAKLGYAETYGIRKGIERMAAWAKEMGPQEWVQEKMPLVTDSMPKTWL